ncbi:MAG: AAA family ATPase [Candidatus Aureabacteria bacterium]|nr:AAA family ATPase [Candidatus Auribacterota bacterium]
MKAEQATIHSRPGASKFTVNRMLKYNLKKEVNQKIPVKKKSRSRKLTMKRNMLADLIVSSQVPETTGIKNKRFIPEKSIPVDPFGDSLNTKFYFRNEQYDQAVFNIIKTIQKDISLCMVIGKSGTGKTMLSQIVIEKLPFGRLLPILVPVTPHMTKTALLKLLLEAFGHKSEKSITDSSEMIKILRDCILTSYKNNVKPVLFIDECHFLSADALHTIRTLSNFEAHNKKILTCILFGEEFFPIRLKHPCYNSLRSRIFLDVRLSPLNERETNNYIKYRLMKADIKSGNYFDGEELKNIYEKSGGIPRLINKICTGIITNRDFLNRRL